MRTGSGPNTPDVAHLHIPIIDATVVDHPRSDAATDAGRQRLPFIPWVETHVKEGFKQGKQFSAERSWQENVHAVAG